MERNGLPLKEEHGGRRNWVWVASILVGISVFAFLLSILRILIIIPPSPQTQTSIPAATLTQSPILEPTSTLTSTIIPTITPTRIIFRPITWIQLAAFLSDDHTNWNMYDPNKYVCLDFAVDLVANAVKQNLKAWVVGVTFADNPVDHAFVAFETTDYSIVFIEPQGDNPYWGMAVGKPLCDSWGEYKCMGIVTSIQYLQCDHSQNCTIYVP